jgi:hypothetical protein
MGMAPWIVRASHWLGVLWLVGFVWTAAVGAEGVILFAVGFIPVLLFWLFGKFMTRAAAFADRRWKVPTKAQGLRLSPCLEANAGCTEVHRGTGVYSPLYNLLPGGENDARPQLYPGGNRANAYPSYPAEEGNPPAPAGADLHRPS